MSVLIKGMEMPDNCVECPLETDYGTCGYYSLFVEAGHDSEVCKRRDDCPLIELPPQDNDMRDIGDLSDGYHTFNGLYYQRMVLFAALVNAHKNKAWKSWKHEDGEPCFGGGWFIVGIDTPEGSYTYHYEDRYWDHFDCKELPVAKHWDGHTEEDVVRLLSLVTTAIPTPHGDLVDKQRMAETNEQHYKIFAGDPDADYARRVVLRMLDQAPVVIPADVPDNNVGNIPAEEGE